MDTHGEIEKVEVPLEVRRRKVMITLNIGKFMMSNTKFDTTMVIKTDYRKLVDDHALQLPLEGFGSIIYRDYAVPLRDAVRKICSDRGWTINDEFGHYPVLHFIASAPTKAKQPATTSAWT